MNCRVAVLARAAHREDRTDTCGGPMAKAVALEAQSRALDLQRIFNHSAMRIVTVVAVLPDRLMLEQEWSTLLGMAGVANVVDRILSQQRFGRAAVRIMAVRAHDLAFAQRHVRRTETLRR